MPYEIKKWSDLKRRYKGTVLLGNGASISVDKSFAYKSLKEHAVDHGLLTQNVKKLFKYFNTDDFELVLRLVWQANKVNLALDIKDNATEKAYEHVRECLIKSVRSIHPEYTDVEDQFEGIAAFLKGFKTVLSLNYDLILYWVIMYSNRDNDGHTFKDCFLHGEFDEDWARFRESLNARDKRTTLVFYPHGNLSLARDVVEQEVKLNTKIGSDLLKTILTKWESGKYIPLFVSEGMSKQKINAIQNSYYLNTIYREVFPSLQGSLVIYGWGLGEHDIHIVERLKKSKVKRVAVSVFGNDQGYCRRVYEILHEALGEDLKVEFFKSSSKGCWNNAA
ncbi:DUF4917 family protein [Vibrio mimicus]